VLGLTPDGALYYRTVTPRPPLPREVDLETGKVLVPPAPVATRYGAPRRGRHGHPTAAASSTSRLVAHWRQETTASRSGPPKREERFLSTSLRKSGRPLGAGQPVAPRVGMTVAATPSSRSMSRPATSPAGRGTGRPGCPGTARHGLQRPGRDQETQLETGEDLPSRRAACLRRPFPDGRDVVFQTGMPSRSRPSTEGAASAVPRPLWYVSRWTTDGRYIIAQALDTRTGLYAATARSGASGAGGRSQAGPQRRGMQDFALHPDNRHFAFSVSEGPGRAVVLENFLRREGTR